MRYELADFEWTAIKPLLPNKTRGVPCINERHMGRSRGGLTIKIHAVVDTNACRSRVNLRPVRRTTIDFDQFS
jgi:transposase